MPGKIIKSDYHLSFFQKLCCPASGISEFDILVTETRCLKKPGSKAPGFLFMIVQSQTSSKRLVPPTNQV